MPTAEIVPEGFAESSIRVVRGTRVMLDRDLAGLYGVEVRVLNQAVTRNLARFPPDFVFRLTRPELADLRSQNVIPSGGWGGRRSAPYAFTEQGVAMLSSVLRSPRAVQVNVEIMRAFVRLRRGALLHADLAQKLAALEKKYDSRFRIVFEAIEQLMAPPDPPRRKIGFRSAKPRT